MDGKHGRTTSGVTCHHRLWTTHTVEQRRRGMRSCLWEAHTIERRRACYDIIAFGQHTRSNDVGRDIPSPPLDSTQGRTTLGVACPHHFWAAHTVEPRWMWHEIIALGRQTWSKNVRRDMPSPPLDNLHGRMTSGVACHHRLWAALTIE